MKAHSISSRPARRSQCCYVTNDVVVDDVVDDVNLFGLVHDVHPDFDNAKSVIQPGHVTL